MIEEIDYRGYTIEVHQDMDPLNPWEFGDCEPPILVYMNGGPGSGLVIEYGLDDQFPELDKATVRKHWPFMLAMMGWSSHRYVPAGCLDLLSFARENMVSPGDVLNTVENEYADYVSELPATERFEAIADAYGWMGIDAVAHHIHGFRQGDWGVVLAVATPDWAESVGAPKETHERQLKNAIKLYEDYAFSSVYGFIIKDPDSHEIDDGSCWGFFGMDHEKSGLLEDAQMTIDVDIPFRGKRLLLEARARTYVRNEAIQHRFSARDIKVSDHAHVEPASGGAWVTAKVFVPVSE